MAGFFTFSHNTTDWENVVIGKNTDVEFFGGTWYLFCAPLTETSALKKGCLYVSCLCGCCAQRVFNAKIDVQEVILKICKNNPHFGQNSH